MHRDLLKKNSRDRIKRKIDHMVEKSKAYVGFSRSKKEDAVEGLTAWSTRMAKLQPHPKA